MRHRWLAAVVLVALVASVGAPTAIVAQTGTPQNPEQYMKLPLYSRDYPACKSC